MKHTEKKIITLPAGAELVDTHCHLDMDDYGQDLDTVLVTAGTSGISKIVTIGIDYQSSLNSIKLARRYEQIYAAVGVHPHNAGTVSESEYQELARLVEDPANKIVAYGEIGLDYFRGRCPKDIQLTHFERQLQLAKELSLPIIIHDRDAHEDIMRLLKRYAPFQASGVMHCFSGDLNLARETMELGLYISIPGIVTFKKSEMLQEVAQNIPLERMLLETDGPFLAPVPHRSKRNQPSYLVYTVAAIAKIRNISPETIAQATTANAFELFGLGLRA
ncbi:MAG: TatD family hydrolase [Desulfobulbaceae bacterium]|nr:TatD family hydrolase [Desulfobulbaceae bacterium]